MAISQKNQKLLANMSPNLIYAFIPQSELNRDTFGKYLATVQAKRDAQRTFIQGVARAQLYTNSEQFYAFVREQLEETYGKSVQDIIYYLAKNGSLPAAKYEQDALAGIKASIGASEAFVKDVWKQTFGPTSLNFNSSTGHLELGRTTANSATNYDTFGNTWKNYYSPSTGYSATALKVGNSYSLVSGSDGATTVNLNTGETIATNQNNFWNNLNNALPAIQGLLATVMNILQQTLSPYQMSPSQIGDGWVQPYNNAGNNMTTALVLTGIVGGAVLLSDDKRK
jgi:hypothetical protein